VRRKSLARRWAELLRPLPLLLLLALLPHRGGGVVRAAAAEPDLSTALARALESHGLRVDSSEVFWVDQPAGVIGSRRAHPRAVVLAAVGDAPADVYLVTTRLSPEGRLLELSGLYNVTDTSAVDERHLTVSSGRAAWVIGDAQKTYSVHLADLRGETPDATRDFGRLQRWQHQLTNLQNTGQQVGIGRRSFKLDPAASQVTLAFSGEALLVNADSRQIRISTDGAGILEGQSFIEEQPHYVAQPGNLVTWAVDRVRAMPWFGSDRMQLVKAVAFQGLDYAERFVGTVTGDDGSERIAEELGELMTTPIVEYTDPETGWPPRPMQPMLDPPLEGEGKWRSLDQDPFVRTNPGAPSPFVTSFIRTDRKRAYSQIFVTLWDPRQVRLHAMSGTVEPKSATGETGPGIVPRRPEVMGRLLAGLNGGFQATHGEWGMMADGVVYLPPKPFAATVAELDTGATGFGTWPNDEHVPDDIVSFRQNMTPLVMDGVVNPYGRSWWGGVPPGWTDESRTVRSGICLTAEGFVAYLYGTSIDADHLALAMTRARCSYGIHLDMNPGHTGLEFYLAGPESEVAPLGRPLDGQWEAEGAVPDMPGWRFRGRRMLRYMGLMNFPRYIDREARDFFYLTLRYVLPGANLAAPLAAPDEAEEGVWRVKGLPQHGWPYSIATTWIRPDPQRPQTKVRVLKLDPRTLRWGGAGNDAKKTVVTLPPVAVDAKGTLAVYFSSTGAQISATAPNEQARALARGYGPEDPAAAKVVAAMGISADGMLIYAEVSTGHVPGEDRRLLDALLRGIGCSQWVALSESIPIAIGGQRDLSGHPVASRENVNRLVRGEYPSATRIFRDTPIVTSDVWYRLQAKRVRYFHKPKPTPTEDEAGAQPPTVEAGAEPAGAGTEAAPTPP